MTLEECEYNIAYLKILINSNYGIDKKTYNELYYKITEYKDIIKTLKLKEVRLLKLNEIMK